MVQFFITLQGSDVNIIQASWGTISNTDLIGIKNDTKQHN